MACCSSEARLSLVKDVAGLGVYEEKRLRSEEELHKAELEIRETETSLVNVQQGLGQLEGSCRYSSIPCTEERDMAKLEDDGRRS